MFVVPALRGVVSLDAEVLQFRRVITFLCGYHPRCGSNSWVWNLPPHCAQRVVALLGILPTCQAWVEFQDAVNVKCVTSFKNIHTNKIQQSRPYIGGRQPVPVFQDVPYQYSPLSCPPLSVIPLRIAFVGDSLVGKTSILYSFTNNCFPDDYVGTTFDSFSTNLVYHGTCKNLLMLDTSGAKGKNEFRLRSYACAQCVVLCFNCVDRESLESCKNFWYNEVIEYCPNVPRLLVATKYDIPTLHEPNGPPMVSKDTIEATSKQMGCFSTQYCSAWTQEGLIGTFHTILSRIGS